MSPVVATVSTAARAPVLQRLSPCDQTVEGLGFEAWYGVSKPQTATLVQAWALLKEASLPSRIPLAPLQPEILNPKPLNPKLLNPKPVNPKP